MRLEHHLFWVAVGVLQQGEATLYSAGLELMEACIKTLNNMGIFKKQVEGTGSAGKCAGGTEKKVKFSLCKISKQAYR